MCNRGSGSSLSERETWICTIFRAESGTARPTARRRSGRGTPCGLRSAAETREGRAVSAAPPRSAAPRHQPRIVERADAGRPTSIAPDPLAAVYHALSWRVPERSGCARWWVIGTRPPSSVSRRVLPSARQPRRGVRPSPRPLRRQAGASTRRRRMSHDRNNPQRRRHRADCTGRWTRSRTTRARPRSVPGAEPLDRRCTQPHHDPGLLRGQPGGHLARRQFVIDAGEPRSCLAPTPGRIRPSTCCTRSPPA